MKQKGAVNLEKFSFPPEEGAKNRQKAEKLQPAVSSWSSDRLVTIKAVPDPIAARVDQSSGYWSYRLILYCLLIQHDPDPQMEAAQFLSLVENDRITTPE